MAAPPALLQLANLLSQLRERLDKAVRNEDYETAADLRDQIRKLE